MSDKHEGRRPEWFASLLGVGGGLLGLLIGAGTYLVFNPLLEASDSPLRELQGFLWNLVPVMTVLGAWLGWRFGAGQR